MNRKNILLGGGAIAVTIALVALISLNLDINTYLGDAINYAVATPPPVVAPESTATAPSAKFGIGKKDPVITGPVPVVVSTQSNKLSSGSKSKLLTQLNGLSANYIPTGQPRLNSHITTDKSVYFEAEVLFASVVFSDAFTKRIKSVDHNQDVDVEKYTVWWDLQDQFGEVVYFSSTQVYLNAAVFVAPLYMMDLEYTGTYTLRVYGDSIVPSYKQIKILGLDYAQDFYTFVKASTFPEFWQPGQRVTVEVAFNTWGFYFGYGAQIDYHLNLPQDYDMYPAPISFTWTGGYKKLIFDLPTNTKTRIGYLYVQSRLQYGVSPTYYSNIVIPIIIRPFQLQVFFWTDSFSPQVFNTTQKVYMYSYFGLATDFPTQDAFSYPANLKNITLYINSTSSKGVKTSTAAKEYNQQNLVNGFGIFNFTFQPNNVYYIQFRNSSTTFRTSINFWSYQTIYGINTLPTIYMGIPKRILENTDQLAVWVQTNEKVDANANYLILVKQHEQIVSSGFYNFANSMSYSDKKKQVFQWNNPWQININLQTAVGNNAGVFNVLIYQINSAFTTFDGTSSITQQSLATIQTWLTLRGSSTIYRRPATAIAAATITASSDYGYYYTGDQVNLVLQAKQLVSNVPTIPSNNVYMNVFVVDKASHQDVDMSNTYNSLTAKINVENDLIFPTGSLSYKSQILSGSAYSLTNEAILATQVTHQIWADFEGFRQLDQYANRYSYAEFVFGLQRYFASSLNGTDDYINNVYLDGFSTFEYIFNDPLQNEEADIDGGQNYYDNDYPTYRPDYSNALVKSNAIDTDGFELYHSWTSEGFQMYSGDDFTQSIYFGASLLADSLVNGRLELSFITNDLATEYSVYVEAYQTTANGFVISRLFENLIEVDYFDDNEDADYPLYTLDIVANEFAVYNESVTYYVYVQNLYNFDIEVELDWDIDNLDCQISTSYSGSQTIPAQSVTGVQITVTYDDYDTDDYDSYVHNYIEIFYVNAAADIGTFMFQDQIDYYAHVIPNGAVHFNNFVSGLIGPNVNGSNVATSATQHTVLSDDPYVVVPYYTWEVDAIIHSFPADIVYLWFDYWIETYRLRFFEPCMAFCDRLYLNFVEIIPSADEILAYMKTIDLVNDLFNSYYGGAGCSSGDLGSYYSINVNLISYFMLDDWTIAQIPLSEDNFYAYRPTSQLLTLTAANTFLNSRFYSIIENFFEEEDIGELVFNATLLFRTNITSSSNPTNQFRGFLQTTDPLLHTYGLWQLTNTSYAYTVNWNKDYTYLQTLVNATLKGTNNTYTTSNPYLLALATLACKYGDKSYVTDIVNRTGLAVYYGSKLLQFQQANGRIYPAGSGTKIVSVFGSSSRDTQIEMQALAVHAFIVTGQKVAAGKALRYLLTNYLNGFTIGGPMASYFAFNAIGYSQDAGGVYTIPSVNDWSVNIFVAEADPSGETNTNWFYTNDPYSNSYDWAATAMWVYEYDGSDGTIDSYIEHDPYYAVISYTSETYSLYTIWSWFNHESSQAGQLTLSIGRNVSSGAIGNVNNVGNGVTFTVSITNPSTNNAAGYVVGVFRVPSCIYTDYYILDYYLSSDVTFQYDDWYGEVTFGIFNLASGATKVINIAGKQTTSGSCTPRYSFVQVGQDQYTQTIATYSN